MHESTTKTWPGTGDRPRRAGRLAVAFAAAASLLGAAGACRDAEPGESTGATPAPAADRPDGVPGAAGTLTAADLKFIRDAAIAGAYEIGVAQLAMVNGTHPTVREYAQATIRDHVRLVVALEALVSVKGLRVHVNMDPGRNAQIRHLLGQPVGLPFDAEFAEMMERSHNATLRLYRRALRHAQDRDVRAFADSGLALLRTHGEAVGLIGADGVARRDPPFAVASIAS